MLKKTMQLQKGTDDEHDNEKGLQPSIHPTNLFAANTGAPAPTAIEKATPSNEKSATPPVPAATGSAVKPSKH